MRQSAFYALILFFALLYTSGLWCRIGVPEMVVQGALFALPFIVLLSEHRALHRPAPGFLFVWFYLGWSLSACIYNGEGAIRGLLYARFLVTAYLIFWAVWNSRFTARQIFRIHTVLLALFILQVAAALFEWLVLGQQVEANVGTMGYETGAIATVFPMFAFSCMLAFFLYYNRPVFLMVGFSFFLVGHASGKLAIYYLIPAMLVLGLVLYAAAEGLQNTIRRSSVIAILALCVVPFLLFLVSHTHRTEMLQNEIGLRNKLASFLSFSRNTALESRSWYTATRAGTSMRVVEETLRRSPSVFLFGQGTHVLLEMSGQLEGEAYDEYGIIYGIVGWSADALTVGWPAMFAHVGFYVYLLYLLLKEKCDLDLEVYWKAVLLAVELGFGVFLIAYFLYSDTFTVKGWVSCVQLFLLALLLAPQYRGILRVPSPASSFPVIFPFRIWKQTACTIHSVRRLAEEPCRS